MLIKHEVRKEFDENVIELVFRVCQDVLWIGFYGM